MRAYQEKSGTETPHMNAELDKILSSLQDAGCGEAELKKAKQLFDSGDSEEMIRHFRKCRCSRMEELHKSQRKVECMDYLIRQTAKAIQ